MKKTILLLCCLSIALYLQAQDTLHYQTLPDKYYPHCDWWDVYDTMYGYSGYGNCCGDFASFFHTNDSLTVYGIAAILEASTGWDTFPENVLEKTGECLRLYSYDTVTGLPTQLGEDLCMNLHPSSVTYYLDLDRYFQWWWQIKPLPVYERYFQTPIVVIDTFLVGFTQTTMYSHLPYSLHTNCCGYVPKTEEWYHVDYLIQNYPDSNSWRRLHADGRMELFLYPILVPDTTMHVDDTTIIGNDSTTFGGDTTGVGMGGILGRLTSVTPNPASTRVHVVSSLGLVAIEVYDTKGALILRRKTDAFDEEIDVATWPRGTYLLHIATHAGTTVKKLLLR